MFIILKAAFLFISIVVVLPIVFFLLINLFGKSFCLTIDSNSWLAKTKVKWIKSLLKKTNLI